MNKCQGGKTLPFIGNQGSMDTLKWSDIRVSDMYISYQTWAAFGRHGGETGGNVIKKKKIQPTSPCEIRPNPLGFSLLLVLSSGFFLLHIYIFSIFSYFSFFFISFPFLQAVSSVSFSFVVVSFAFFSHLSFLLEIFHFFLLFAFSPLFFTSPRIFLVFIHSDIVDFGYPMNIMYLCWCSKIEIYFRSIKYGVYVIICTRIHIFFNKKLNMSSAYRVLLFWKFTCHRVHVVMYLCRAPVLVSVLLLWKHLQNAWLAITKGIQKGPM